jgi:hypothetical protein
MKLLSLGSRSKSNTRNLIIPSVLVLVLCLGASTFAIGNVYATQDVIELDQTTYNWTSIVGVAIVAPEYDIDPSQADTIGINGQGIVMACTNEACIPISLTETKPSSGIFTGAVTLTGDPSTSGASGTPGITGITSKCTPVCDSATAQIRAEPSDKITITFTGINNQKISASGTIISTTSSLSSTSSDYSNYGLLQGEWVQYKMHLQVDSNDAVTKQQVEAIMTKMFSGMVGQQLNSLDDIDWIKETVTQVLSSDITTHSEVQVLGKHTDLGDSSLSQSHSTAIPINSQIGDVFDSPLSTASNPNKITLTSIKQENILGSNINVFELTSSKTVSGVMTTQVDQTLHYDSKTGILLDWLLGMKIYNATDSVSVSFTMTPNGWSQISSVASTSHAAPPSWVKTTAKLWSQGDIGNDEFIKGIQYLIQQGIITVPSTQVNSQTTTGVPSWIKTTAKLWSQGQISDDDFVKGLQYLVQNGLINPNPVNPQQGNQANQQQNNPVNQQQGNPANQQGTNTGSSGNTGGSNAVAKDLTGNWAGTAQGTVSFDYYEPGTGDTTEVCTFQGPLTLTLQQDGTHLTGNISPASFTVSGKPICQQPFQFQGGALDANIFGSGFRGTVEGVTISGQFTSDLLRGTFSGDVGTLTIQGQFTASRSG